MLEKIKPGRLLAELGVVILGVAIALAADGWREDQELRDRELAYLQAIKADMTEAREVLQSAFAEDTDYLEKTGKVLALLRSTEPLDATSTPMSFPLAQFSVPIGTLKALINSGELNLVLENELRTTLITETAKLETYLSWIDQAAGQAIPNLRDVLLELESIRIGALTAGETVTPDSYRASPQIAAGYITHAVILQNTVSSLRSAGHSVENIHKAVSHELSQRGH